MSHNSHTDASGLITQLEHVLADTYTLMLKYHNYHWNVTGPDFFSLHEFFEDQYEILFKDVDTIAEVLRQYRVHAPGTMNAFMKLTAIKEFDGDIPSTEMKEDLAQAHRIAIQTVEQGIQACDELHDEATHDMLNELMDYHRKTLWMIEASLA